MPRASIIDYPRDGLDTTIWSANKEDLDLQPKIKDEIIDIVESFVHDLDLPEDAVIDVFIYGSILTNQYNSKTDVDARILLDPDVVREQYPGMTGDALYDLTVNTIHGVLLGDTQHPFNATVVIEGEDTELGQSPLGISDRDPVYSMKSGEVIHEGTGYDDSFDPDVEFMEERSDVTEIMTKLDSLAQDAKTNTIDIEMLSEAVSSVDNPNRIIEKIEDRLDNLNFTIEKMVHEYNTLKEERSTSYKEGPQENRHKAPGNIKFKFLEKYKYMDMLKKLKKLFKDGIDPAEIDDVAETLNVKAYPYNQPGLPGVVEAPPTTQTGPAAPSTINTERIDGGGMMHGGSECPKCGHVNPMTANDSGNVTCESCGKKFKAEGLSLGNGPSTPPETNPYGYESDFQLSSQTMSPQVTEDMVRLLRDVGVSDEVLKEFEKKLNGEPVGETETRPEQPDDAQVPEQPGQLAPTLEQPADTGVKNVLKPGIQMNQMQTPIAKSAREWQKADFVDFAKLGEEFKSEDTDNYAVILQEMSEPELGDYRVQWYNSVTPIGHTVYKTFEEAAERIYGDLGPAISEANGSMDTFALSEEWIKALKWLAEVRDENLAGWLSESVDDIKTGHLLFGAIIMDNLIEKLNRIKADSTGGSGGTFGEPPGKNPGDDPYSSGGGALAEYGTEGDPEKEKKKNKNKNKQQEPDEDVVLEVVTVLDGLDILPFIEDDELLMQLMNAFPMLSMESAKIDRILEQGPARNALLTEAPAGSGQYDAPTAPDYDTVPKPMRRKHAPEDGSGKGKGRPGGLRRNKKKECPFEEDAEAVGIDWFDSHPSQYRTSNDEIKTLVTEWLKDNPNPDDDAVHALAEEIGMETDDLEEVFYEISTDNVDTAEDAEPSLDDGTYELTEELAAAIGEELGVNWDDSKFDAAQLLIGLKIELEHGTKFPETNVTNDDLLETGKIALAHLNEIDDYYDRLTKLEDDAKKNVTETSDNEEGADEEEESEESGSDSGGSVGGFTEGFPGKSAAAYMTLCPNCKTVQKAPMEGEGEICPFCNRGWLESLEEKDPEKYQEYKEQEAQEGEEFQERRREQRGVPRTSKRVDIKSKKNINAELREAGMSGDGRFQTAGLAFDTAVTILSKYGIKPLYETHAYSLGDSDILLEEFRNEGRLNVDLETLDGESVENTKLIFTYYQKIETTGEYEIIAYMS